MDDDTEEEDQDNAQLFLESQDSSVNCEAMGDLQNDLNYSNNSQLIDSNK